jgi:uncharacterized protein DUF1707/cell wall-active antibiotic response 4TMS protein YvqF
MDRSTAVQRLASLAAGGGLTLGEYADRAVKLDEATTDEQLDQAFAGLPEQAPEPPVRQSRRWLVGVFGGAEQRGRWRLGKLRIVAFFGGATLDLGQAQVEGSDALITVFALLGGVDITAPPNIPLQLSGLSLLGGRSDKRPAGTPLPGAPLVRVRVFAVLGGLNVKAPGQGD